MKRMLCLTLFAGLLLVGCSKETPPAQPTQSSTNTAPSAASENPLNAPGDYLSSLAKAQKSAVKTVDLAALTKAIEMFQVSEGRLPKDLNELVTEGQISRIPAAPTGMKITYDPATGKVRVVNQ